MMFSKPLMSVNLAGLWTGESLKRNAVCHVHSRRTAENYECVWLVKNMLVGRARNLSDKSLFHNMSLVALLAWVGLGADGFRPRATARRRRFWR